MLSLASTLLVSAAFCLFGGVQLARAVPILSAVEEGGNETAPALHVNLTLRDLGGATRHLEKRFDDARFTFYDAGLGACGQVNTNSDFIVALNAAQWDNRAHCGETVTISYGGRTARARIMDLCPGCPYGGLDMSRGLFSYFASQDLGVIHGSWNFGGSSGGGSAPRPSSSSTPRPTTTRITTTRSTTTTSSTTRTSTRTSTTRPTPASTRTPTSTPTPTPTPTPSQTTPALLAPVETPSPSPSSDPNSLPPNVLQALNDAFLRLGVLISTAGTPEE